MPFTIVIDRGNHRIYRDVDGEWTEIRAGSEEFATEAEAAQKLTDNPNALARVVEVGAL